MGFSTASLEAMKLTSNQHNDFLAHKPLPGVRFEHNDYVLILSGEYKDQSGSLVSVEELGEDPLFLLELESGIDITVRQSQIERNSF